MKRSIFLLGIFCSCLILNAQTNEFWEPHAKGLLPEEYGIFTVSTVSEDVVWATAYLQSTDGLLPVDHEIKIIKTVNGGDIWQLISVDQFPGYLTFDLQAINENVAWMTLRDVGRGTGFLIAKTEDGGMTWTQKLDGEAAGTWVRFFNENEGFAGNFPNIAYTEDGGETWTRDSLENFYPDEGIIIGSGNNSCVVVGDNIWAGTSKGRVGHSSDKGKTWDFYYTGMGTGSQIVSIAFKDELNGMIMGNSIFTRFATTSDGGKTWNILGPSGIPYAQNLEYIPESKGSFIASTRFGRGTVPVSAMTTDFGESWTILTEDYVYGGVDFSGRNSGWIGIGWIDDEETPALAKWIGDGFSNITEPDNHQKINVFPNPGSDKIFIELPENESGFSFSIYNGVGTKLSHISKVYSGEPIDISYLPEGIYFLKSEKGNTGTFMKR